MSLARLLLSPPACRDTYRDMAALRRAVGGRAVLVTGASYGIGEATARLLAQAGAHVLLLARTAGRLDEVAAQIRAGGGQATCYPCDLTRPEEVTRAARLILAAHPRIAVLVSNAGRSIRRPAREALTRDDLGRCAAVNLLGPARLVLELLPALGGALVVNVSSVSAAPPAAPRWAAYQASKAGFDLWLRAVAAELGAVELGAAGEETGGGLRACSVYLPLVRTRMSAVPLYAHLPALTPRDAAQVVARAVVARPARLAPWWWGAQELAALLFPGPLERALGRADAWLRRREP